MILLWQFREWRWNMGGASGFLQSRIEEELKLIKFRAVGSAHLVATDFNPWEDDSGDADFNPLLFFSFTVQL